MVKTKMPKTGKTKLIEQLVVGSLIGAILSFVVAKLEWRPPSLLAANINHFDLDVEWNRVSPALIIWFIFFFYWSFASRNSAPTMSSESRASTYFHQLALNAALMLLFLPVPRFTGWFLPHRFHFLVAVGVTIQAAFVLLAVWARRHLGRNWSADVRIGEGHELVRSGPYKLLRHPIYTAMLGMFLGTAIASSQYHALLGLSILVAAYLRKTRLEERILRQTFGADFHAYRQHTWALVPLLF
jgi:protein-S-isoprenylcysteine O-methyltransferase Ste14